MTEHRLATIKTLATIFAAVAVPLIVAVVGWQIQASISKEGVRKDYVQMAIGILSQPKNPNDKDLRQWAVAVLDKNSPVPFTSEVRSDLASGIVVIRPKLIGQLLNTSMMEPPQDWVQLRDPKNYTLDELVENYLQNMQRAKHNFLGLEYLQQAVKAGADIESSSDNTENASTDEHQQ